MDRNNTASSTVASGHDNEAPPSLEYVYVERKEPRPDFTRKPKSKLSKFLSKFQSPAVKKTEQIREQELEEAEQTGVRKIQTHNAPGTAWAFL